MIDAFNAVLPELPELKKKLNTIRKQRGYVPALDGRPLYIRSPHMTLVSLMQGDEAVAMEMSMCRANDTIHKLGLDAEQLMYYHDEFEWEVSDDHALKVGELLEEAIAWPAKYLNLNVALAGTSKIGNNWAEVH